MLIWFKCEEENLMIGLETDTKPSVGDTIRVQGKYYTVNDVVWCLEEAPAQSGIIASITQKKKSETPYEIIRRIVREETEKKE